MGFSGYWYPGVPCYDWKQVEQKKIIQMGVKASTRLEEDFGKISRLGLLGSRQIGVGIKT